MKSVASNAVVIIVHFVVIIVIHKPMQGHVAAVIVGGNACPCEEEKRAP